MTIGVAILLCVLIYYLIISIYANSDMLDGKYSLFMDESITFDAVKRVYDAGSLKSFFINILDSRDYRYGKIYYNLTALASAFPRYIWGEAGQIFATRMFQAIVLAGAYLILVFALFRSWIIRGVAFTMLVIFPVTSYYATMPKPEPIQIFFLALFLWRAKKNNFRLGMYWVFLGISLGAKVSLLPHVFCFGLIALYIERKQIFNKKVLLSCFSFIAGFLIGEPVILLGKVKAYLNHTIFATSHGADDSSITVMSWLKFIFKTLPPLYIYIFILSGVIAVAAIVLLIIRKTKNSRINLIDFEDKAHFLIYIGLFLLSIYMLQTDRLWSSYLFLPFVTIIAGMFYYLDKMIYSGWRPAAVVAVLCMIVFIPLLPKALNNNTRAYYALAHRTDNPRYVRMNEEYIYIKSFLDSVAEKTSHRLKVFYDPHLFMVASNEKYLVQPFYDWFHNWDKKFDIVIYYPKHTPEGESKPDKTNINYSNWVEAMKVYGEYVVDSIDDVKSGELKYVKYSEPREPSSLRIYIRSDLYNDIFIKKD